MLFDWFGSVKDVLLFASYAGTIGILVFRAGKFTRAIESMQAEISSLRDVAKTVADVLTAVAVQKVELSYIRKDIDEIKHGRGLIA